MKFIHAIVVNKDTDTLNWDDLKEQDYTVHCLYSVDNEEIIFHNDNIHSNVEDEINAFYDGIEFCGFDPVEERVIVVVGENDSIYDEELVYNKISNEDYIKVD